VLVKTTHQKVLALFLADPSRRLYGSEISKKVGISIGQTSKILGELLRGGVVEKERKGKTELYSMREFAPELRLYKTLNTVLSISSLVNRLKSSSKLVILFGSCAQGTNTVESDLDLFVVSSARDEVLDVVARYSPRSRYGYAEIRPVIKSPAERARMEADDPVFFGEVQKGIVLFEKSVNESRL
ncbi:MAG TPA: nucleotidyltransferase domain-containing protein, partial [Nitrospirota bacterium]|nr:nucleotidyltransferase domain-containing protein [Nitrospirota bacterium]